MVMTSAPVDAPAAARPTHTKSWHRLAPGWVGVLLALPIVFALVLFVFYPLVNVFTRASSDGGGISRYVDVFTSDVSRRALTSTLLDGVIVVALTIVLGAGIAWVLHTTQRKWLRVLLWTTALVPFWIGVIVKNYAIFLLLAANGPVNQTLLTVGVIDEPLELLFTKTAVVLGITYSLLPYAVLSLYSTFMHISPGLLSAAEILGASRVRALGTVAFPMARSGIAASMAMVFVLSIGFYVTPILLGGAQAPYMATRINQQVFALYDVPAAAANAAVVLVIALAVVALVLAIVGGRAFKRAVMQ